MQSKNIILITLATAFILLLILLVMQFTDEVVWVKLKGDTLFIECGKKTIAKHKLIK